MTLSRSPSPVPGGGWSSPGLNINSGRSSPNLSGGPVAWESSKMRSHAVNGYPSFSTQNQGFFTRHMRRLSSSLPRFSGQPYSEKEKLGRGRWWGDSIPLAGRIRNALTRMGRKWKVRLAIALGIFLFLMVFYNSRKSYPACAFIPSRILIINQRSCITGDEVQLAAAAANSSLSWPLMLEEV